MRVTLFTIQWKLRLSDHESITKLSCPLREIRLAENILWKNRIAGIFKLNHIIIKVSIYCPFWYLLLAGSQLISNQFHKAQQNKREKLVKWNKCRSNDATCTRSNACYYINMEWHIYLLSGIKTNECKKYWVLPTPLYAYQR